LASAWRPKGKQARAVFFDPGVFDEFSRVAALVKAAIF
jgi:hypothetical protein